jgi:transcriptional regulator with XRE-family HTH domain
VAYEYSKLLGRITEKFGTQAKFAEAMGLSERSLSLKLNGRVGFKQSEITKACQLLDISGAEITSYFFTLKVQ